VDQTFATDGYAVVRKALSSAMLDDLRRYADARLAAEEREHFQLFKFHGSMLPLDATGEDVARRLVLWSRTLDVFARLGLGDTRWLSGYIISKPARSPSLWWHQDWWAWDEPISFSPRPSQVFVMYYLRDVDERNGALRVIPGSHRRSHPLHTALPDAHSSDLTRYGAGEDAHARQPDEVTVAVEAGDAVIGDSRLLHSTHANDSDKRRTCLTLWYLPDFERLPDSLRAYVIRHPSLPPAGWWRDGGQAVPAELQQILPTYDGDGAPAEYNRRPPVAWPA
jgi:hypothetical protein